MMGVLGWLGVALALEGAPEAQTRAYVPLYCRRTLSFTRGMVRAGAEGGTQMEGYGTRLPYRSVEGGLGYEVGRIGPRKLGPVVGGYYGRATGSGDPQIQQWMGLAVAPGWTGADRALMLAVGPMLDMGDRPSSPHFVRVWPLLMASARTGVGDRRQLGVQLQGAPLATDGLRHRFVMPEAWVAYHHVMVGVYSRVDWRWAGDPVRLYRTVLVGGQVGLTL